MLKVHGGRLSVAGVIGVICVSLLARVDNQKTERMASNGIEAFLVFFGIMLLVYVATTKTKTRDMVLSLVTGSIAGFGIALGQAFYDSNSHIDYKDIWIYLTAVSYSIVLAALINISLKLLDGIEEKKIIFVNTFLKKSIFNILRKNCFWVVLVSVILLWIPAFIAMFPGYYSSDGPLQLNTLLNKGYINLQWPAAHTLLLAACFNIGNALFGSYNAGLVMYCLVQSLFLASAMAYAALKLYEWNIPFGITWGITVLMAANPVLQAYAFSTTKDAMFGGFLLLMLVKTAELVFEPETIKNRRKMTAFILIMIGVCLMRKQGMYILIIVAFFCFFFLKEIKKKRQAFIFIFPLICVLIFNAIIPVLVPVQKDNPREMLSIPSQQIARVYCYERASLGDQEIEQIDYYYDLEGLGNYIEPLSDPAKGALDSEALEKNFQGFIKLWVKLGVKYPGLYCQALMWGTIGYVYPSTDVFNRWSGLSPWNEFSAEPHNIRINAGGEDNQITQSNFLPLYYEYLQKGANYMFPNYPLLTLWVHPSLPYFILLFALIIILHKRDYRKLIIWIVPGVFWGTVLLGPVMCIRYVCPLFYCIPFMVLYPFVKKQSFLGKSVQH